MKKEVYWKVTLTRALAKHCLQANRDAVRGAVVFLFQCPRPPCPSFFFLQED